MPPFKTTRKVTFSDTDMAGIVHFSNYYRWMEEAEHEFFRSLGLRIMERQADGSYWGWPRVSSSCNYLAPARYEDVIEARVAIERVGFKSLSLLVEFWKGDTRIAHGRMKTACCICRIDEKLESIEIPANYRQRFEEAMEAPPPHQSEA
jgi:acyl-CoA thioester hydrolase